MGWGDFLGYEGESKNYLVGKRGQLYAPFVLYKSTIIVLFIIL